MFLKVLKVYFHSDFCGRSKRHSALISYMHFSILSRVAGRLEGFGLSSLCWQELVHSEKSQSKVFRRMEALCEALTWNPIVFPSLTLQFYRALNIRVALVGLEVWSDVDKCPITQDPFTTLHEFLDWRKVKLLPQKPHDNAQLIRFDD